MSLHAESCPDLTGKFSCGKDGKFQAEITKTGPKTYKVQGPFDLPETIQVDGEAHFHSNETESYLASCYQGDLYTEIAVLRDSASGPRTAILHARDRYILTREGFTRERSGLATSEVPAKSKMHCALQREK